jgi:CRP-like cAMP-binding protein
VQQFRKYDSGSGNRHSVEAFTECKMFRNLSVAEIREIASCATTSGFKRGSFIFECGDPADFMYIVQEGSIKLHTTSPSGKNVTFSIAIVGDTLNASALSTGAYFLSAQALTDVAVLRIGRKEFFGFVARFPNLALEIINVLAWRLKAEYERMVDIQKEEVDRRVSQSLLALARKFGTTFHLKREELAEYAGTTTETTIRVLSRLKKKGIVSCSSHRGEIVISDLAKLESLVNGVRSLQPGTTPQGIS